MRARCGIDLDETKGYLVDSRWRRMREDRGGVTSLDLVHLAERGDDDLAAILIDAISTKETSFFRDRAPFDLLGGQLGSLLQQATAAGHGLQVWSAACSTGQEAHSIAMVARERLTPEQCGRIQITGSDLSPHALEIARTAEYGEFEMSRGLDEARRHRHFIKAGERWRLRDELRAMSKYEQVNLIDLPPPTTMFDVIFCRNIATYFDIDHRRQLFEALAQRLRPHGLLILGSTESLIGVTDEFVRERELETTYYRHR